MVKYVIMKFFISVLLKLMMLDLYLCDDERTCAKRFKDLKNTLDDSNDTLYLLSSSNPEHKKLNELFNNIVVTHLGAHVRIVDDFCPEDEVKATEIVAKEFTNVINLRVTNRTENLVYVSRAEDNVGPVRICSNSLSSNVEYDTSKINRDRDIPVSNNSTSNHNKVVKGATVADNDSIGGNKSFTLFTDDIYKNTRENSTVCETKEPGVKLITNSVKNNAKLYNIIKNFSTEYNYASTTQKPSKDITENKVEMSKIVICDKNNYSIENNSIWFENVYIVKDCIRAEDKFKQNLLAILAPKPLEREDRTMIPVLFYETPFLLPEHKDMYPNSILLYKDYNTILKHALIKFMRERKWHRIAIVSDDSPFSDAFQSELTNLFDQKAVVYTVKQCNRRICDFTEALKSLQDAQAKIIIANVDVHYSKILANTVVKQNMTSRHGFMWIWRDWPFPNDKAATVMGTVFSIYVAPDSFLQPTTHYAGNVKSRQFQDIIHLKITRSLENLPAAAFYYGDERRSDLYRKIARRIEQTIRNHPQVDVHVRRILANGESTIIFSVSGILPNIENNFKIVKNNPSHILDLNSCFIRSNNYNAPCDDNILFMITLVILVFLVALIAIQTFFYKYARRKLRNYTSL